MECGAGSERFLRQVRAAVRPGGTLVAVHWRHPVADYPQTRDAVHRALRGTLAWPPRRHARGTDLLPGLLGWPPSRATSGRRRWPPPSSCGDRRRPAGVVVPARDEQDLLRPAWPRWPPPPRCRARRHGGEVVVVADGCTDSTVTVARRAGVTVLDARGDAGNVGKGPAPGGAGVCRGRRAWVPAERVWLANTDADSRCRPTGWRCSAPRPSRASMR